MCNNPLKQTMKYADIRTRNMPGPVDFNGNIMKCATKVSKEKPGKRSKPTPAPKKRIVIHAQLEILMELTPNAGTISPSLWLAPITLFLGTKSRFIYNVQGIMEQGKDRQLLTVPILCEITARKSSKSLSLAGGRLTLSKTGRKL